MSKQLFLLETDEALNGQLVSYLKNFFDISLGKQFDSAENFLPPCLSKEIIFSV